jgi:hypothetical protein
MRRTFMVIGLASLIAGACGLAAAEEPQPGPGKTEIAPPSRPNEAATATSGPVNPQQVHVRGATQISRISAAQIATALRATSGPPRNSGVDVKVGGPLPGNVDVQPLPTAVVDLVPEYRGYDYVVANDDVVIVEPSTRKVVEVISQDKSPAPAGGTGSMPAAGPGGSPRGP